MTSSADEKFDYLLANPPFGVDWKKQQKDIEREHEKLGFAGRFGAGLPRVNDGALLFLQHMISKFEPVSIRSSTNTARALAIVFSGSPLFTGGAGSGESDIRKWIIENDWLEAIVALPEQMFYNTGIGTYIWIVTNRKEKRAQGQNPARGRAGGLDSHAPQPGRQAPQNRRGKRKGRRANEPEQIAEIVRHYGRFETDDKSKIFDNADFGYTRVTDRAAVAAALSDDAGGQGALPRCRPHLLDDVQAIDKELGREPHLDWNAVWARIEKLLKKTRLPLEGDRKKSCSVRFSRRRIPVPASVEKGGRGAGFEADADLRDFENIPLKEDIEVYFKREVLPHVPDAWMDRTKDKVGYEINFNRHFYRFTPPRRLAEIDGDLKKAEEEILRLLREVTE